MNGLQTRPITRTQLFLICASILLILMVTHNAKTLHKINTLKLAMATEAQYLNQADLQTKEVDVLKERWQQRQPIIRQIQAKIPSNENLPELLSELSTLADQCGVSVTELILAPPSELHQQGGLQTKLQLELQGSYDKIKTYMGLLLVTDRYFTVDAAELYQAPGRNTLRAQVPHERLWTARISLNTFFFLPFDDTISSDQP